MSLTAEQILSIAPRDRGRLFPAEAGAARRAFRDLAAAWHPDVSAHPRATEVFAHLLRLRDAAAAPAAAARILRTRDGRSLALSPLSTLPTDTGELLVGRRSLTWIHRADVLDLAEAGAAAIAGFRFADEKMRRQMAPFLPSLERRIPLADGGEAQVMARRPDEMPLADLLRAKGAAPPEHAAWIGSGLLNISCWLAWAGLVHGAIAPETILVSPERHVVPLAGGWEFATPAGTRPTALPARTLALAPRLAVKGETVAPSLDLELVRRTIRETLGDPAGAALRAGGALAATADRIPDLLAEAVGLPVRLRGRGPTRKTAETAPLADLACPR